MIKPIKNIVNPKALMLAMSLTAATVAGATVQKDSAIVVENSNEIKSDIFELQVDKGNVVKITGQDDIKYVKKQFNTLMNTLMVENPWEGYTSGINEYEYSAIAKFLEVSSKSKDPKIVKWAEKKLSELEHLKDSKYNEKTKAGELNKSQKNIEKYEKELENMDSSGPKVRSFLLYLMYKDDYQKIYDHHEYMRKLARRNKAYYTALNISEHYNVLSAASAKKLMKGSGLKVK